MLAKLTFVMQRQKKHLKNFFVMINKDGGGGQCLDFMGDTAVMKGDKELMGVPPVPLLGKPCPEWQFLEEVQLWALLL